MSGLVYENPVRPKLYYNFHFGVVKGNSPVSVRQCFNSNGPMKEIYYG